MKFGPVPLERSPGKILAHKLIGDDGRKLFGKGHVISESDLAVLRAANLESVIVADLESTDLHEDVAAKRVGEAIAGDGIQVIAPGIGRANLVAAMRGPLYVSVSLLDRLNNIDEGITIATLREHTFVNVGDLVALVKIIPFAVPEDRMIDIEAMAQENVAPLRIRALRNCSVALILSGPESARAKLMADFIEPVRKRVENLDSALDAVDSLDIEPDAVLTIYRESVDFPLQMVKQVFTNADGSVGILYLVTSDLDLTYDGITTIYSNHVFASLCAYIKLEMLKVSTKTNHFALKAKALRSAFQTLDALQPVRLAA